MKVSMLSCRVRRQMAGGANCLATGRRTTRSTGCCTWPTFTKYPDMSSQTSSCRSKVRPKSSILFFSSFPCPSSSSTILIILITLIINLDRRSWSSTFLAPIYHPNHPECQKRNSLIVIRRRPGGHVVLRLWRHQPGLRPLLLPGVPATSAARHHKQPPATFAPAPSPSPAPPAPAPPAAAALAAPQPTTGRLQRPRGTLPVLPDAMRAPRRRRHLSSVSLTSFLHYQRNLIGAYNFSIALKAANH